MKTLIRVQHSNGRGMFQFAHHDSDDVKSVYEIPELRGLANRHNEFPTAFTDLIIKQALDLEVGFKADCSDELKNLKWRFCFNNINQFEEWVLREEVAILKNHDYRVYKIEATNVISSEYQSIFDINSVKSIVDITDLFI